ncbi:hypothetical protein DPMN_020981 [Dreissena polymorpha]|uniref:Uncharacterized protein n=1 Tax=Dreissena polymorpha TaxID=45954 RepID=A0A9D4NLZ6_DREPO|nr:hypothetical protein DPMN_020981 [Dreissena polymorpha]
MNFSRDIVTSNVTNSDWSINVCPHADRRFRGKTFSFAWKVLKSAACGVNKVENINQPCFPESSRRPC